MPSCIFITIVSVHAGFIAAIVKSASIVLVIVKIAIPQVVSDLQFVPRGLPCLWKRASGRVIF